MDIDSDTLSATAIVSPAESSQGLTGGIVELGCEVLVRHNQRRLGGDKYPGRKGVVIEENRLGRSDGGLWYVRLHPTTRAKERVETFWTRDLDVIEKPSVEASNLR